MKLLLTMVTLSFATPAVAQDVEDLDGGGSTRERPERTTRRSQLGGEVIREIERGYYLKSNVGSAFYLINYGGTLSAGTAVGFAGGSDFVDNERSSAAWEVGLATGVHNGMRFDNQARLGVPPNSLIQGDTRTFTLSAGVEYSAYPSRRFGIGVRGGAGLMLSPLLMDAAYYQTDVEQDTWGTSINVHRQPHPLFFAGPTIEYYTKLSHLSLGADVDASYALGFDLGITATGYLKYTF
jgi:hypothetical protein